MKEDALQKGLPVPDEAAIRERVLRKDVEGPGSRYSNRFLPVSCGHKEGENRGKKISDSLNTFAERFFTSFERIAGTPTNADDRSEVYNVSILHHL